MLQHVGESAWRHPAGFAHLGENVAFTVVRELQEETGLIASDYRLEDWHMSNRFEIYRHWRGRYEPGVTHNTEHVFGLRVPHAVPVTISPREHLGYEWVDRDHAIDKVFSWTNAAALRVLPDHASVRE